MLKITIVPLYQPFFGKIVGKIGKIEPWRLFVDGKESGALH